MGTKLITENTLSSWADLVVANKRRLYRLWLIAPWIGSSGAGGDALVRILDAMNGTHCRLISITRPPILAWHDRAVSLLRRYPRSEVFTCAVLHTKLYVLECDGFRAAAFGSPNLTPAADTQNTELAVEFRTTVQGSSEPTAALVSQLQSYAWSLRNQENVLPID